MVEGLDVRDASIVNLNEKSITASLSLVIARVEKRHCKRCYNSGCCASDTSACQGCLGSVNEVDVALDCQRAVFDLVAGASSIRLDGRGHSVRACSCQCITKLVDTIRNAGDCSQNSDAWVRVEDKLDNKDIILVDLKVPVHVSCIQYMRFLYVYSRLLNRFGINKVTGCLVCLSWFDREQEWRRCRVQHVVKSA